MCHVAYVCMCVDLTREKEGHTFVTSLAGDPQYLTSRPTRAADGDGRSGMHATLHVLRENTCMLHFPMYRRVQHVFFKEKRIFLCEQPALTGAVGSERENGETMK